MLFSLLKLTSHGYDDRVFAVKVLFNVPDKELKSRSIGSLPFLVNHVFSVISIVRGRLPGSFSSKLLIRARISGFLILSRGGLFC